MYGSNRAQHGSIFGIPFRFENLRLFACWVPGTGYGCFIDALAVARSRWKASNRCIFLTIRPFVRRCLGSDGFW